MMFLQVSQLKGVTPNTTCNRMNVHTIHTCHTMQHTHQIEIRLIRSLHRLCVKIMSSSMTKSEILAELGRLGELPPKQWTKVECLTRMEELRVERGLHPNPRSKNATPLRKMMLQLNQASTKKDKLIDHTIPTLQKKCLRMIYDKAESSAEDPVGFGMHAARTYLEIQVHEKQYAEWVIQTYQEGQCDPRLARLATWLLKQKNIPNEKIEESTMIKQEPGASSSAYTAEEMAHMGYKMKHVPPSKGEPSVKSWTSGSCTSSQMAQQNEALRMLESVQDLKEEIKDMKEGKEPARKKSLMETP